MLSTVDLAFTNHIVVALKKVADLGFTSLRIGLTCWSRPAQLKILLLSLAGLRSLIHVDEVLKS